MLLSRDVGNGGELFGKEQSAGPRRHAHPRITIALATVDDECWWDD